MGTRPGGADKITHLGYPIYFLTILGIWKLLGDIAILIPKYPLLKEWAYAGFFFAMSGAIYSHVVAGDSVKEIFPSAALIVDGGILVFPTGRQKTRFRSESQPRLTWRPTSFESESPFL